MDHNIRLILVLCVLQQKYLKEDGKIESFLTLQRESGITLIQYSKELQFFKTILIKGDFTEAINFIFTFQSRIEQKDFKKILLDIYKQKLYELIQNPDEDQLKSIFEKQLINYCNEEQFQELFNCLTFRTVNEIEGLQTWTPIKGRYDCFQKIIPYFEMFNSILKNHQLEDSLDTIIDFYNKNRYAIKATDKDLKPIDKDTFQKVKANTGKQQSQDRAIKLKESNVYNESEKQIIKNSVIHMNLSNNYSQMNNKNVKQSMVVNSTRKGHHSSQEQVNMQKSNAIKEINPVQKNHSAINNKEMHTSIVNNKDTSVVNNLSMNVSSVQKRPRVNASLNGPMSRQKGEGSLKVDNYVKNDQSGEQNMQFSMKNVKLAQKYQLSNQSDLNSNKSYGNQSNIGQNYHKNQSNLNNDSNASAYSKKYENKSAYPNQQDSSHLINYSNLSSSHLNEITEEEPTESIKSVKPEIKQPKYSYLMRDHHLDEELSQDIQKNIQYLEQTNSVVYNNKSQINSQHFTFQQKLPPEEKDVDLIKIITKLAVITDNKAIRTCQFSQTGNHFAIGTNSSILKIFDIQQLYERNKLQQILPVYQIDNLHQKSIFCLDWSKNQRSIITCSNDLQIKVTQISKNFSDHRTSVIGKHESCIRMVKFSENQSKILSCGDDSTIKVWDVGKAKKCLILKGHTNSVGSLKLQNENELYSVSKDMTIKRWDIRVGENVATSKVQDSQLTYIANNSEKIVVSHKNGCVSFFNESLQLEHSVQIHEEEIRSIEALKGQNLYLTASFDGYVALFSQENSHLPNYFQHNDTAQDKVVYANFLHSNNYKGFSSTSTQGLCHIYSYQ